MENKFKQLVISLILCLIIYIGYTVGRDLWIIYENENYKIIEVEMTEKEMLEETKSLETKFSY